MKIIIDPTLEDREKDNYYFVKFYCSNCDRPTGLYQGGVDVMIPEKQKIPTEKFICPYCKCKTLTAIK